MLGVLLLAFRRTVLDRLARATLRYTVRRTPSLPTFGSRESLVLEKEQADP